jgi:hypothetical protein
MTFSTIQPITFAYMPPLELYTYSASTGAFRVISSYTIHIFRYLQPIVPLVSSMASSASNWRLERRCMRHVVTEESSNMIMERASRYIM